MDIKAPPSILVIDVIGVPAPQGSKSFKGMMKSKKTGRMIPRLTESSEKVRPWRNAVSQAVALARRGAFFAGAIRLTIEFAMPRKGSMDKPRKKPKPDPRHTVAPDLSKLIRCTEDAITDAGAWANDSRVCEYGPMIKRYAAPGEPTGCRIIIESLE